MTDYKRRTFTYRPIEVAADSETVDAYGLSAELILSSSGPTAVAVLTVELDRIETILPNMAEFEARYEAIEE